jgi:c-di-GMP-binding flagellar brake protein YcgR
MGKAYLRRYPRISVRVAVDYTAGEESSRCIAGNLGGGGLFLANVAGLEPGKQISVRFRPAKHLPMIQAKASVRHLIAGRGTGIEFAEITEEDRHKILRLIHQKTGDRRLQPRAPLATQLECDGCMTLAFSRDIGINGMFIESAVPLPVGVSLTVRFNLDQKDRVVTATAQVAYRLEKMGMGVCFTEIEPQDRDAIREYVESTPVSPSSKSTRKKLV